MTETSPPVAAVPVPYRTATIVTLVATVATFVLFSATNSLSFGTNYTGLGDFAGVFYVVAILLAIACFVVSIVLRSRTKRLGLPRGLSTATVVFSSILIAYELLTAIVLVGAFLLLAATFLGG